MTIRRATKWLLIIVLQEGQFSQIEGQPESIKPAEAGLYATVLQSAELYLEL